MPTISYTKNNGDWVVSSIPTYKEVKSELKRLISDSSDNQVCVYRSKRGEWGEWFEHWSIDNNKLIITKQGWQ